MKVVLDTNVLIAAFATQGLCHALFELCIDQQEVVLSEEILNEFATNMGKKLKAPASLIDTTIQFLREHTQVGKVNALSEPVVRDRSDDHVLSLAEGAKVDYVITGDQDLLILKKYKSIPIVQPRQFWEILRNKRTQ